MAPPTSIPMNLSYLNNIPPINTSIFNITTDVSVMALSANTVTNGWFGFIIMIPILFIMYWVLADKTPYGDFGYSDIRALSIALAMVTCLSLTMLEIGYITNFRVFVSFAVFYSTTLAIVTIFSSKEQ